MKVGKTLPVPTGGPTRLVINGLNRYFRNPMYLGVFLILISQFLLFGYILLLIYSFLVISLFHL